MRSRHEAKAGATLAVAGVLVLISIRPDLLRYVAIGCILGLVIALAMRLATAVAQFSVPGVIRGAAALLATLILAPAVISIVQSTGAFLFEAGPEARRPFHQPAFERHSAKPSLLEAISYEASLKFDDDTDEWLAREFVHVPRLTFRETGRGAARLLGPHWRLLDYEGENSEEVAYRRSRRIPMSASSWPPISHASIPLGTVSPWDRETVLVPQVGSRIELRAPGGMVREVDAVASERHFDDQDVFVFHLTGSIDNPSRRIINLRVANGIGRWSVYQGLEAVTTWTIVVLLFAGVPAFLIPYLLTRFLDNRLRKDPQPGPVNSNSARPLVIPFRALDAASRLDLDQSGASHYRWDPESDRWLPH